MKLRMLSLLVAVGMLSAMPAFATHQEMMKDQQMQTSDESARQCALQAESLQEKIKRIQGEINKGSTRYSAEELKKMSEKLKEANETLENLMKR